MRKKIFLTVAAFAILGLSACDDDGKSCKSGMQKCSKQQILTCLDGQWEVTEECADLEVCNPKTLSCEVKMTCETGALRCNDGNVEVCSRDLWQIQAFCKADQVCDERNYQCETPTERCELGDKRCLDNKLQSCLENGFWGQGVACHPGQECINEAAACTDIGDGSCQNGAVKCVGKAYSTCVGQKWETTICASACHVEQGCVECNRDADCPNDAANCENMQCYACKSSDVDCIGQVYKRCKADQSGYEIIDCAQDPAAPYCLVDSACVQCRDHEDCGIDANCNAAHQCEKPETPSSLSWCSNIEVNNSVAVGRVIDLRTPKDAESIIANLLCGELGQTLKTYQKISGKHQSDCPDCGDAFEYQANLKKLTKGDYLCLWSFSLPDEKAIVCKTDGTVFTDLDVAPSPNDALSYDFDWDKIIDFEKFEVNQDYSTFGTITDNELITRFNAAIYPANSNGSIDSKTAVISTKFGGYIDITHQYEEEYVAELNFDYRAYRGDDFGNKGGNELKIYYDWDPDVTYSIPLKGPMDSVQTATVPIHQKLESFQLVIEQTSDSNRAPRLLIDNIRWKNQP